MVLLVIMVIHGNMFHIIIFIIYIIIFIKSSHMIIFLPWFKLASKQATKHSKKSDNSLGLSDKVRFIYKDWKKYLPRAKNCMRRGLKRRKRRGGIILTVWLYI